LKEALVRLKLLILAICVCVPLMLRAQDPELKKRTPENVAAKAKSDLLITLDIEVADAQGKAVQGLLERDFVLKDNGEAKQLNSFQEIDALAGKAPVEVILVLDAMNASFEDVAIMRQGMDAFLQQNGGHLQIPVSVVFLTDMGIKLHPASVNGLDLAKDLSGMQTPMHVLSSAQGLSGAIDREQRSVSALQMLATYEASKPGRKLMVWMGPGWPLLAGARMSSPSPENARRFYSSIVDTTTQLRRARITLYSVAPLNLHAAEPSAFLYQDYLKGVTTPAQADTPNLAVQVLAVHSGGLVLSKSGDLPGEINRCVADASSYYEVAFDAVDGNDLGVYRSIEVVVDRPGAKARTNTAYYAGVPQSTGGAAKSAAAKQAP
jgi:VWFA-related protein